MPFALAVDPDTGVVLDTWTGRLTIEQVYESIRSRRASPLYDASTPRLVDLSQADGDPSLADLHKLAAIHRSSSYRGPCAFVAPRDIQYGLSRAFQAIASGEREVEVFRSVEPARVWLGERPNGEDPSEEV